MFDIAVIGGGIVGSSTALFLARGGMKVALLERGGICMEASGRNSGTLTLLFAKGPLVPLVLGGKAMWEDSRSWLQADVGYHATPGIAVALTPEQADNLERDVAMRRDLGLPIELLGGNRARELEPALSPSVRIAARSRVDGFAASNRVGLSMRRALIAAGVIVRDRQRVTNFKRESGGFVIIQDADRVVAQRLVIAANVWTGEMLSWLGLSAPSVTTRVGQVVVTERARPLIRSALRVVEQISLKQTDNGTFLIGRGAGFDGFDDPRQASGHLKPANLLKMLRSAVAAVPQLAAVRALRSWHAFDGFTQDGHPIAGPVSGMPDLFVSAFWRSGWTAGPYIGRLTAEILLGLRPETDLFRAEFDPARNTIAACSESSFQV